jgi:hypothetical protein
MRDISNITGPIDYGEEPGEVGDTSTLAKNSNQELIRRANAVPIIQLFRINKVRLDKFNKRTICPFKSHKNGQEKTPSFWYFPNTNSFNCYGCHVGGGPTDFIMHFEEISKVRAANKILELFEKDVDESLLFDGQNIAERMNIMMEFSNSILEFRQKYDNNHASQFIEYICWVYDCMNSNYIHDNDALRGLNVRLIDWIHEYGPELSLSFEDKYLIIGTNKCL